MTTDIFLFFYLQNRLNQTSETGGQQHSDTSPFSIPCSKTLHGEAGIVRGPFSLRTILHKSVSLLERPFRDKQSGLFGPRKNTVCSKVNSRNSNSDFGWDSSQPFFNLCQHTQSLIQEQSKGLTILWQLWPVL